MNSSCKIRSKQGSARPSYALIHHAGPFARRYSKHLIERLHLSAVTSHFVTRVNALKSESDYEKPHESQTSGANLPLSEERLADHPDTNAEIKNGELIIHACRRDCVLSCAVPIGAH